MEPEAGAVGSPSSRAVEERDFAGRRVLVTGAGGEIADGVTRLLVAAGAEVHTAGLRRPTLTGIASYTTVDWRDADAAEHVLARVGSVVEAIVHAADAPPGASSLDRLLAGPIALRALAVAAPPKMSLGGPIVVGVSDAPAEPLDHELAALDAESLADRLHAGPPGAEEVASTGARALSVASVVAADLVDSLAARGITLRPVPLDPATDVEHRAGRLVDAARFGSRA